MRNSLLRGVALAVICGTISTAAFAQSPVFNSTTRPGKLDGAGPGSVQVNIGGTLFSGIEFSGGSNNSGDTRFQNPNLLNYFRLYPNFDYQSPSGVHFGASAEIRSNGSAQDRSNVTNTLNWFSATGYVTSENLGKFEIGTPNDAIDQLGVGIGDDFGTGGFYSEYGWVNSPTWVASDAYDGDNPKQKLTYLSPSIAGFTVGVSYQPTSVGATNCSCLLTVPPSSGGAVGAASKDRVEAAVQFAHAFGPASVKADVGYAFADAAPVAGNTLNYKSVSYLSAGASIDYAGFELEGSLNTGQFSVAPHDGGNWGGPEEDGARDTTAWTVGTGYRTGPYSVGVVYYNLAYDAVDGGATASGPLGQSAHVQGVALGAGYQVGPGVRVLLDAATNTNKLPGNQTVHGNMVALGTYFSW